VAWSSSSNEAVDSLLPRSRDSCDGMYSDVFVRIAFQVLMSLSSSSVGDNKAIVFEASITIGGNEAI
jgi:hypothetical protein